MKNFIKLILVPWMVSCFSVWGFASEVIEDTRTAVIVRNHPNTGKPYVSIVSLDIKEPKNPFSGQRKLTSRPDYRMLDPKTRSGEIPYDGPSSGRKKVYVFAATLAAVGTIGGAAGMALAPAATGAGASGGAGAYLAGGSAVVAGTAATTVLKTKPRPGDDDYTHISEAHLVETENGKNFSPSTDDKL
jgi:hypothetical protein